jgi:hypothetical protein
MDVANAWGDLLVKAAAVFSNSKEDPFGSLNSDVPEERAAIDVWRSALGKARAEEIFRILRLGGSVPPEQKDLAFRENAAWHSQVPDLLAVLLYGNKTTLIAFCEALGRVGDQALNATMQTTTAGCGSLPGTPTSINQQNPEVQSRRVRQKRMSKGEANDKAMELAQADPSFVDRSAREWAGSIGCSEGLVSKLPLWRETMKRTNRGKKGNGSSPKATRLTSSREATLGAPDSELQQLIEEQQADKEPSPCEDDPPDSPPRNPRHYKRV